MPLFYAINVAIAYRLTQVFHSGYRLRHAYGKLTEDYSVLNQRLEQQLVELDEARRQVEASGPQAGAVRRARADRGARAASPTAPWPQVNHAAEILFGYAAAELVGGPVKKLVLPEFHDEFDAQLAAAARARASRSPGSRSATRGATASSSSASGR